MEILLLCVICKTFICICCTFCHRKYEKTEKDEYLSKTNNMRALIVTITQKNIFEDTDVFLSFETFDNLFFDSFGYFHHTLTKLHFCYF